MYNAHKKTEGTVSTTVMYTHNNDVSYGRARGKLKLKHVPVQAILLIQTHGAKIFMGELCQHNYYPPIPSNCAIRQTTDTGDLLSGIH